MSKQFPDLNNELTLKHLRQRKNEQKQLGIGTCEQSRSSGPSRRAGAAGRPGLLPWLSAGGGLMDERHDDSRKFVPGADNVARLKYTNHR